VEVVGRELVDAAAVRRERRRIVDRIVDRRRWIVRRVVNA
jgi:hypothetical protein